MPETAAATTVQQPESGTAAAPQTEAPVAGAASTPAPAAAAEAIAYQSFNLPDGYQVNAERMGKFNEWAAARKLSQADAQELVDMFVAGGTDLQANVEAALLQQHEAQVKAWEAEARADKDIGGAAFDANLALAQSAIGRFGGQDFKALLDTLGVGNHPAVLRTFLAIGKQITEDTPPNGGQQATQVTPAEAIYTHPTSRAQLKFGT